VHRPNYIAKEDVKEREVFLNGEVSVVARPGESVMKKTQLCLKALSIETKVGREAVKNIYNLN
jgi:hypothetical protein